MQTAVAAVAALFVLLPSVGFAQGVATDILKVDIEAVLSSPDGGIDRQIKVVDIGKLNMAVGVLHRGPTQDDGGPPRGLAHTQVTEVYYVLSGSGTLMTGGTVVDQSDIAADSVVTTVLVGPSVRGTFEGGSQVREISAGDVVVIPAGVFHGWSHIEDHVTYLSVRPDPDKVLPVGYVNPAVAN